jgi:hypothetical protein
MGDRKDDEKYFLEINVGKHIFSMPSYGMFLKCTKRYLKTRYQHQKNVQSLSHIALHIRYVVCL